MLFRCCVAQSGIHSIMSVTKILTLCDKLIVKPICLWNIGATIKSTYQQTAHSFKQPFQPKFRDDLENCKKMNFCDISDWINLNDDPIQLCDVLKLKQQVKLTQLPQGMRFLHAAQPAVIHGWLCSNSCARLTLLKELTWVIYMLMPSPNIYIVILTIRNQPKRSQEPRVYAK
jgi:hypothetical protein